MADYLNAVCSVCGKKYHICSSCSAAKTFTSWRKIACSANCYKIFSALSSYTNGYAKEEETAKLLRTFDLTESEHFLEPVKRSIDRLLKTPFSR